MVNKRTSKRIMVTRQAFTLVELLVTIAILAGLAGLLFPAINGLMKRADATQAEADVLVIKSMWKNYFNEYGRWPLDDQLRAIGTYDAGEDAAPASISLDGVPMASNVLMVLTPRFYESQVVYNPKRTIFFEYNEKVLDEAGDYVDPWGNPYRVLFDHNRDGRTVRASFDPVMDSVMVWSYGPDGEDGSSQGDPRNEDNISSWD